MIKIDKDRVACPDILLNGGDVDSTNCHRAVVDALHDIQYQKCCYCEKNIFNEGQEQHLEHFRPRANNKYPELKNEWTNLLHACGDCNGQKGQKFDLDENGDPLFIDPSDPNIDPEDHLRFNVDFYNPNFGEVKSKDNSRNGDYTIREIGLDRLDYRRDRVQNYPELVKVLLKIRNAPNNPTKQQEIQALENMLKANKPYAAFARAWARYNNLDSLYDVTIPVGSEV